MTVTFPLSLPATPTFRAMDWRNVTISSKSKSPFTGAEQIQLQPGEWWEVDLDLPQMQRADAAAWRAFNMKLRGFSGYFLLGPVAAETTPRGSAAGSPVAETGGSPTLNFAGSSVLHTRGWTVNAVNVLREGDWLQLGSGDTARLHQVLGDVSADAGGRADLDIFPRLRQDVADAAALTLNSPKGLFRLAASTGAWSLGEAQVYGIQFSAAEKLP